jgi:hypothetical protein
MVVILDGLFETSLEGLRAVSTVSAPLIFSPVAFAFVAMVIFPFASNAPRARSLANRPIALLQCNMAYMRCSEFDVKRKMLHCTMELP